MQKWCRVDNTHALLKKHSAELSESSAVRTQTGVVPRLKNPVASFVMGSDDFADVRCRGAAQKPGDGWLLAGVARRGDTPPDRAYSDVRLNGTDDANIRGNNCW